MSKYIETVQKKNVFDVIDSQYYDLCEEHRHRACDALFSSNLYSFENLTQSKGKSVLFFFFFELLLGNEISHVI